MKARLIFKLPEDQEELDRCNASLDMAILFCNWDNYMRSVYRGKVDPLRSEEALPLRLTLWQRLKVLFTGEFTPPTYSRDEICETWFEMKNIDIDKILS